MRNEKPATSEPFIQAFGLTPPGKKKALRSQSSDLERFAYGQKEELAGHIKQVVSYCLQVNICRFCEVGAI